MKEISLSNSDLKVLVDDEDYDNLSQYTWTLNTNGYAIRTKRIKINRLNQQIYIHRHIMKMIDSNKEIDHINHNRLDNRKCNLRICTPQQNLWNSRGYGNATSKYKGVSWNNQAKKWQVFCLHKFQGLFDNELIAALRYDQLSRKYYGEYAYLNFPIITNYDAIDEYLIKKSKQSSKYIGVTYRSKYGWWDAYTTINKKHKFLGSFDAEIDAAKAYDKYLYENRHLRTKIKYNFPDEYKNV